MGGRGGWSWRVKGQWEAKVEGADRGGRTGVWVGGWVGGLGNENTAVLVDKRWGRSWLAEASMTSPTAVVCFYLYLREERSGLDDRERADRFARDDLRRFQIKKKWKHVHHQRDREGSNQHRNRLLKRNLNTSRMPLRTKLGKTRRLSDKTR